MKNAVRIARSLVNPGRSVAQVRCVYDNLGDIMVYLAIDRLLEGVNIASFSQRSAKLRFMERVMGIRRAFGYSMLGGGTLIFSPHDNGWLEDLRFLQDRTEPLCTFGTGVIDPEFIRQVYEGAGKRNPMTADIVARWLDCLQRFRFVGIRGVDSALSLKKQGWTGAEVIGDPAVAFAYEAIRPKRRSKKIGVNLTDTSYFWGNDKYRPMVEMSKLMGNLVRDGWEVRLFPASREDLELARRVRSAPGLESLRIADAFHDVQAFIDGVAEMDLFVAMRLHSFVAACCSYTPALVVGYQPKCLDFTRTLGVERLHIKSAEVSADDVMCRIGGLYDAIDEVQQELFNKCNKMKRQLQAFAARIKHYLEHGEARPA